MSAIGHAEFAAGYRDGRLRAQVDAKRAADFMSARMLLPLILLPVFGIAVALALVGYLLAGAGLFVAAFAFRLLVRASGKGYVLARALERPEFYAEAVDAGLLRVENPPPS